MTKARWIKWVRRILTGILVLITLFVLSGWFVLESRFLSETRRSFVAEVLSNKIGQEVHVDGDIRIRLGPRIRTWIEGVTVKSRALPDVSTVEIGKLRFDLETTALIQGGIEWDNFVLEGARILLFRDEHGIPSWITLETDSPDKESGPNNQETVGLVEILRERRVRISDSILLIQLTDTGFRFRTAIDEFHVAQLRGGDLTKVLGTGTLNGQLVNLDAEFPRGEPFKGEFQVGQTVSQLNGESKPGSQGRDFQADVDISLLSTGDFLEAIGLKRTTEGHAQLSAEIRGTPGVLAVEKMLFTSTDHKARQLTVKGDIGNLRGLRDTNLSVDLTFQNPPTLFKPLPSLPDLTLESVSARVHGDPDSFLLSDVAFETNSFNPKLRKIGPMEVERLFRTPEGEVSLLGIGLVAGDETDPYLTAEGDIRSILELEGIDFASRLKLPATEFFPFNQFEDPSVLGMVVGNMGVSDHSGQLGVTQFDLNTIGTDTWAASVSMTMGKIEELQDVQIALSLVLPNPSEFMALIGNETAITDPVEVEASLTRSADHTGLKLDLRFDRTEIETEFRATYRALRPVLTGLVSGKRLHVDNLRDLVELAVSLSKTVGDPYAGREAKPLVITREARPLVIEREAKPLVLGEDTGGFEPESLVRHSDVQIGFDIDNVQGVSGLGAVDAELGMRQGVVTIEPVKLSVIGGTATLAMSADLMANRHRANVTGRLHSVALKTLLDMAELDMDASGKISGRFNLALDLRRLSNLMRAISGTVHLRMDNGRVATSLLELAGLGVVRWLFSAERNRGYTDLVCMVAPLRLSQGIVTIKDMVADTSQVRMVVNGQVNFANETLAVRAVPRPIARAGARSPFPVNVSGSFSAPRVQIQRGEDSRRVFDRNADRPVSGAPCSLPN